MSHQNQEQENDYIKCSECKDRIDVKDMRAGIGAIRSYCGQRIPHHPYPVFTAGLAPFWCPKRPRKLSQYMSGVFHVELDFVDSLRCSACGREIIDSSDGIKYCSVCEQDYVGKPKAE